MILSYPSVTSKLSAGSSALHGNYGLSDQEAVLQWVNAHISLVGGDNRRVTVGAERRGADITSLHLLSSSSSSPLFQRVMLMVRASSSSSSPSLPLTIEQTETSSSAGGRAGHSDSVLTLHPVATHGTVGFPIDQHCKREKCTPPKFSSRDFETSLVITGQGGNRGWGQQEVKQEVADPPPL